MSALDVIYESEILSRVILVSINGKKLVTPTYFPAVSSYGIRYSFDALARLLTSYSYPRLLVSAYDFYQLDKAERKNLADEIAGYSKRGCFVFLDSGIYESSWKVDTKWTYDLYRAAISSITFDFFCSFDVLPYPEDQIARFTKDSLDSVLASSTLSNRGKFVPILHGTHPDNLVSLVATLVEKHPHICNAIAVSERDCGNDIIERARTILKIRKLLDTVDRGAILHILGCGNPTSLILFSYCGANSFDSLDWTKYVIERNRFSINDFSHLQLIDCACHICSGRERNYIEKVLLHNLLFYQNHMQLIQSLIRRNAISEFLNDLIGQDIVERLDISSLDS